MKALKISLALIVTAAITYFVIRSLESSTVVSSYSLSENQFTKRIEQEIDSLSKMPDNRFCDNFYREINYHIDSYHKDGRLGASPSENDQWKEIFTNNLYSFYADRFIRQAFYVFRGSEWKIEDLAFIGNEYQSLRKSKLLEKGSPVDKKIMEIQTILSKYNEITSFISACKGFSYLASGLSNQFPISDVQSRILRAATYRRNGLGNEYVNNCTRLHDGLKEVPQTLFRAHIRYLDNKIDQWSGMYPNYNSQSDYANNLYKPIKSEIDAFDNDIYNAPHFDREYERLSNKWSVDNAKAYNHKYN